MASDAVSVRRATIEDLDQLRDLWKRAGRPMANLDKPVTDFQVALDASNAIQGTLGIRISDRDGCLYAEAAADGDINKPNTALREALWTRMRNVANNHGLVRLWTCLRDLSGQEPSFEPVSADLNAKRPPVFNELGSGPWQVAVLREESPTLSPLEQELQLFQEAQRASAAKIKQRARALQWMAYLFLTIVLVLGAIALIIAFGFQSDTNPITP